MVDVPPLVNEAMKKAGVVWLRAHGADRAMPAWVLWRDGLAYLVTGPGEQPGPGFARGTAGTGRIPGSSETVTCDVIVPSADRGGRIVTWRAVVSHVVAGSAEWDEVVPALVGKRLNLPDHETAASRWASDCGVFRLEPTGELPEAGRSLPATSLAEPPPPSPARTVTPRPFTLGRASRRR